jgi:DNA polymerase-3 subunit alpha
MTAKAELKPSDFVHLHNHTQYSLLDGLTKVPALIDRVVSFGMHSVAMTDHGTLSGTIEFYKEAKSKNIRPIIGLEAYVAPRRITDKDPSKDKAYHHLILLAKDNTGYQNLMQLSTVSNLEGFYYKPRIDRETLKKYNEGLIVLSGCIGSELGDALRQGQYELAKKTAQWYKSVFGDRYYLEVQDHGHKDHPSAWLEQVNVNQKTLELAEELKIQSVLTCDAHYLSRQDQEAHEILLCVQTGAFLADENRMSLKNFELHLADPQEVIDRWGKTFPDLITNTRKVAERCNVELSLGNILIPKFPLPKGKTEKGLLQESVYKGLAWRYGGIAESAASKLSVAGAKKKLPAHVAERAKYELEIIDNMGFNGYFLIISDFINWGKNKGIVFGPGRGSAAGSIISYGLRITELDPFQYNLLFERFLNPDRISMPDIDIDIQDSRRDEVIKYCIDKYGEDRVANIVTFGRMAARNAIRDVARVLQVPYVEADRLAKMIPPPVQGRHIPLATSLTENADLKNEYASNETSRKVLDYAVKLEGTIRSHGVHAAGVVIAPDDIVKFVPLETAQKGVIATQYPMYPIEELGLLKIDFLGLSTLTIIKNALRIVKKVYKKDLEIGRIPLNDEKTYELFQHGDTIGVFQLESSGMKRYLKELKPTVFDDIIAMVALYRPGPMQFIDNFIARKHGRKKIEYLHPKMKNALESTYGVLVYQEQFMQISKDLAGFSGGQADTLRKAVGKKIMTLMKKIKPQFIEGAITHSGAERTVMEKFWDQLEEFANYCFNKSHAACYALIAYWTAYLKANYPAAFMAALMTSDYDDIDRLAIEITECRQMGIEVLPPDINESFVEFAVVPDKNQIRFGLSAIKNVGTNAVEEVLRARGSGRFADLETFLSSVNNRVVNRKTLESLIKSGAFDGFGDRNYLLHNLDVLLAYSSRVQKEKASGQTDLFGNLLDGSASHKPKLTLEKPRELHLESELLIWERELLGLYLSSHPLQTYENILEELTVDIIKLKPEHDGKSTSVGGVITDTREIITKNRQKMAFVKISDKFGEIELVLFPSVYQLTNGIWERDKVVIAKGKVSAKNKDGSVSGGLKILVADAREITPGQAAVYRSAGKKISPPKPKKVAVALVASQSAAIEPEPVQHKVYIKIEESNDQRMLLALREAIDDNKGETEVVLVLGTASQRQIIRLPMRMEATEESLARLSELVGTTNVKLH